MAMPAKGKYLEIMEMIIFVPPIFVVHIFSRLSTVHEKASHLRGCAVFASVCRERGNAADGGLDLDAVGGQSQPDITAIP